MKTDGRQGKKFVVKRKLFLIFKSFLVSQSLYKIRGRPYKENILMREEILLKKLWAGDVSALDELVRMYYPWGLV